MADDVTQPGPLRGGRQRANHIQVHRLELGLWERRRVESLLMASAVGVLAPMIAVGAGVAGVGYACYLISLKYSEQVDQLQTAVDWVGPGGNLTPIGFVWDLFTGKTKQNVRDIFGK